MQQYHTNIISFTDECSKNKPYIREVYNKTKLHKRITMIIDIANRQRLEKFLKATKKMLD